MARSGLVRRSLVAGVALVIGMALLVAPASGAPKKGKANLRVTALTAPPEVLFQASGVRVRGKVANRGKRAGRAKLVATLNSSKRPRPGAVRLGTTRVRVPAKRKRNFRIDANVRRSVTPGRYWLVVCVKGRGGNKGPRKCKLAKRAVRVTFPAGSRSLGDELFPQIGNGGSDAKHYTLSLVYDPDQNAFEEGTETELVAEATQDLGRFSLDFDVQDPDGARSLEVTEVLVDGQPAEFSRTVARPPLPGGGSQPMKLVVTPREGIPSGEEFTVLVRYEGTPAEVIDPDGSSEGWIRACYLEDFTPGNPEVCDGAFVVGEPIGAQGWFPSNNFPTDKATFDTNITVPDDREAFGVGELVEVLDNGDGTSTWRWSEDDPTATYLTTATNGDFIFSEESITEEGTMRELPQYVGIDAAATPGQLDTITTNLGRTEEMVNFLAELYGPYPFDSGGAVADAARGVGYALEVQTKPHYSGGFSAGAPSVNQGTLLHEIAHQWFGNAVTLANWNDIWFNEGWAEWSTWSWESNDDPSAPTPAERFQEEYDNPDNDWSIVPTELDNDPANLFEHFPTYVRGAMTLEGYRQIVGEQFVVFARELQNRFAYGNVTTEQVVDLAVEVSSLSGEDRELLEQYFQQWLYEGEKPTILPDDFND